MANMNTYRDNQTPIPSFTLQVRDWEAVGDFIVKEESYDDVVHELRVAFKGNPAPTNQQNITVTTLTVKLLTLIFERFYYSYMPISDGARTRIREAITTASVSVPILATLLIDKDTEVATIKQAEGQAAMASGRKRFRKNG